MFKKNDYIVVLKLNQSIKGLGTTVNAKVNYIFKQNDDRSFLQPSKNLAGEFNGGNRLLTFDKKEGLVDWRYSTKEEKDHYDEIDKPYDITTLDKANIYDYQVVHTETELQFDFLKKHLWTPDRDTKKYNWNIYTNRNGICLNNGEGYDGYTSIENWKLLNNNIISFDNWINNQSVLTRESYLKRLHVELMPKGFSPEQVKESNQMQIVFEYYRYVGDSDIFTKGKIYKINNPRNLEADCNFIDDKSKANGFRGANHEHFQPATIREWIEQEIPKTGESEMTWNIVYGTTPELLIGIDSEKKRSNEESIVKLIEVRKVKVFKK